MSRAGSGERSSEVFSLFVGDLQLGVALVIGVITICAFGLKIARRTSRSLIASNGLAFSSQPLCIRSCLNLYHGDGRRELAVIKSEKKAVDQNPLSRGMRKVGVSLETRSLARCI